MVLAALAATTATAQESSPSVLTKVDHLVYATSDLERGIKEVEELLGVRALPGGRHPGRGTRNALIALGPNAYLEIVAPDPDQPPPPSPRSFNLDSLTGSRLVTWAAAGTDLDSLRSRAVANGVPLGEVRSGSRQRPDGVVLSWRFTDPRSRVADGLVPFFIDWGQSPHPAHTSPPGATLVALRAEHPDDRRVQRMLDALGLDVPVRHGPRAALIAVIDGRRGRVELR